MKASRWWQWPARVTLLGIFAGWLGYCSTNPSYQHLAPALATIKVSVHHSGQVFGECRERSPEELAALPANMRAPLVCPRERSPLHLELDIDGRLVLSETLPARGIHRDGRASTYHRLSIPAGEVTVAIRMKDHLDQQAFPYQSTVRTVLRPGANLVIDFDNETGRFVFLNRGERLDVGSDERATLEDTLNDLEAGNGQYKDHHEVDEVAVRQRLTPAFLDQADNPVRKKVQADGDDREEEYLSHRSSLAA
ncbi:MAG: hypothetical protein AB7I04_11700 [Pseudomonadales bacterium]